MDEKLPEVFIAVYMAAGGWQSVMMVECNDPEMPGEGHYEPAQTGYGPWPTREEAEKNARGWAEAEELPYVQTN